MIKFEKKVLKNGLRVVLAPMENTEAVTLLVLVGVGSNHEAKKINGVSHFLEHLFFKGTKSRPRLGQIHKDLDKIGADHNAFTSKEITGFWVKTSSKDFGVGLDIVSNILLEPLFKKEEIEKERGVILQELNMYEDIPQQKVWDELYEVAYGDQPNGRPIGGIIESVNNISRLDILKHKNSNYFAENIVVVAAGGFNKEKVFGQIAKSFQKTKKGEKRKGIKTKNTQKSPRVRLIEKSTEQSHVAVGLKAYDMFNKKRHVLSVLSTILGGNSSSRLFTEIREKLGLAYYVGSTLGLQSDSGILALKVGLSPENLEKSIKKIFSILEDFKNRGVSKKELNDAKSFIRGQTALNFETSDAVADFYGAQELFYKKIEQPEDYLKKIEKVSQNDILKVACDIFVPTKINMAIIGTHGDTKKKEDFYKKLFSKL